MITFSEKKEFVLEYHEKRYAQKLAAGEVEEWTTKPVSRRKCEAAGLLNSWKNTIA